MTRPVACLREVTKSYPDTPVLDGVDLTVHPGEKISVMGPSGSGKSTLLAIMAGLVRPDSGAVEIGGLPMTDLDDAARARLRACTVGIAQQSDNLIPFLSAVENVELALSFAGGRNGRNRAMGLLGAVRVADRAEHFPRQLSGGESRRVALATALANQPALLLADEVAAQLDARTTAAVVHATFAAELAVVFVTHDRVLADRANTRLVLVDHRLVAR